MLVVSAIDCYTNGKGLLDLVNGLDKFIPYNLAALIVIRQNEEGDYVRMIYVVNGISFLVK